MTKEELGIKHLEIIQGVISRMASNSFLLKGWTVTLIAALVALATQDLDNQLSVLALFPTLAFWFLDAYYLQQERLYRKLYEDVCRSIDEKKPFPCFSLDTSNYKDQVDSLEKTMIAPTIIFIHGFAAIVVAWIIL